MGGVSIPCIMNQSEGTILNRVYSGLWRRKFALKNDGAGDVGTSNYVQDTYTTITDYESVTAPTAEGGDPKEVFVWLALASEGLMPGEYSGLYLQCVDL